MSMSSFPFSLTVVTDPKAFTEFKTVLVDSSELSRDALHMHIGLGLALLLFVILGRRWWSAALSWLTVLLLSLWGERLDHLSDPWPEAPAKQYWMSVHDVLNTMFWPTVLLLTGAWLFKGLHCKDLTRRENWRKLAGRLSGKRGDEPLE